MKTMAFLTNPPRGAIASLGAPRRKGAGHSRRSTTAQQGESMAAKKKPRRHARRRSNPPVTKRHHVRHARRRRNPPAFSVARVTDQLMGGLVDGAYGVAGKVAVRKGAGMLGFSRGSTVGYLVEAALGVVGGMVVSGFSKEGARAFVQGGFMSAIEELAVKANVPVVSAALSGYNDYMLPTAYNAGMLNPASATGMGGYPGQGAAGLAGYPGQFGDFDMAAESYGR